MAVFTFAKAGLVALAASWSATKQLVDREIPTAGFFHAWGRDSAEDCHHIQTTIPGVYPYTLYNGGLPMHASFTIKLTGTQPTASSLLSPAIGGYLWSRLIPEQLGIRSRPPARLTLHLKSHQRVAVHPKAMGLDVKHLSLLSSQHPHISTSAFIGLPMLHIRNVKEMERWS